MLFLLIFARENKHVVLKKHFSLWCREGKFPPCPAEQEVVQRPSQTVLRVLAATEPVWELPGRPAHRWSTTTLTHVITSADVLTQLIWWLFFLLLECPIVRELHVELDEVSQLLDVSKEQYDEILSIVQHHTDETVNWLSKMAAQFSWVAQAVNNSSTPENIFRVTMVSKTRNEGQSIDGYDENWDWWLVLMMLK